MSEFVAFLRTLDASVVALTIIGALTICVVWSWHANKSNDFHLQQVLVDNVSGKISVEKVGYMTALAVSTWIMISLTLSKQMTEGYLAGFLGIFALSRAASSGLSVWKDKSATDAKPLQ